MQSFPSPDDTSGSPEEGIPQETNSRPEGAGLVESGGQEGISAEERISPGSELEERRLSPRRRKLLRVLLIHAGSSSKVPFPGWVVDRSLGGMCLSVDHPIDAGEILIVRRPNAPDKTPWVELCVQSLRTKEDTWEIGCSFVRTPTWEILIQFG